jgi:hypothetical protein
MEGQKIDLNSLVVIEQLPKIREALGVISDEIDRRIEKALALDCTEESKTEVKKYRANLNKIKEELEDRRKQVKEQIMNPYLQFEGVYNELVKDKLANADKVLKERIDTIEIAQREEKIQDLIEFAKAWLKYYGLEQVLEPKQVIPNITLSKNQKSLKEQIKGEIERISKDIQTIALEEMKAELLVEYVKDFDYAKAKFRVFERQQQLNDIQNSNILQENVEELKPIAEEQIVAPKEIVEEELIECTFTVNATKEQLLKIKEFLQELGVQYE